MEGNRRSLRGSVMAISVNLAGPIHRAYRYYQDFVPNTNEIGNTWIVDGSAATTLARRSPKSIRGDACLRKC